MAREAAGGWILGVCAFTGTHRTVMLFGPLKDWHAAAVTLPTLHPTLEFGILSRERPPLSEIPGMLQRGEALVSAPWAETLILWKDSTCDAP